MRIDKVLKINSIFLIDQLRLNQPGKNPTIFYDKAVVIHQNNQKKIVLNVNQLNSSREFQIQIR
jgi:hypothetical protein